ncbi:unnamed protein product [Calicophoron daubneyi]|uniref:Uncharacterized protein n=1 Tax=Calicophoron daubneyi TaxID=300641 RepID=A0AAV2TJP7_CALDB
MACKKEKPAKGILKMEHETGPSLGAYNLYAKRASFKDDVIFQQFLPEKPEEPAITPPVVEQHMPIAPEEGEEDLTPEEIRKRNEFKEKRRLLALEGADGLDIKAVLAHRVSLVDAVEEEQEPSWEGCSGDNPPESFEIVVPDRTNQPEPDSPVQSGSCRPVEDKSTNKSKTGQDEHMAEVQ